MIIMFLIYKTIRNAKSIGHGSHNVTFAQEEKTILSPCNDGNNCGNCNNENTNNITKDLNTNPQLDKKNLIATTQCGGIDEGIVKSTLLDPSEGYEEV